MSLPRRRPQRPIASQPALHPFASEPEEAQREDAEEDDAYAAGVPLDAIRLGMNASHDAAGAWPPPAARMRNRIAHTPVPTHASPPQRTRLPNHYVIAAESSFAAAHRASHIDGSLPKARRPHSLSSSSNHSRSHSHSSSNADPDVLPSPSIDDEDSQHDEPPFDDDDGGGGGSEDEPPDPPPENDETKESDSEVDSDDTEEELKPLPRGTELLMRACMCIMSLVLLWATSLTLAEYIASSALSVPSFAPVINSWKGAWSIASLEADMHASCLTALFDSCGNALNQSIVRREMEWRASVEAQRNETARIQLQASTCQSTSAATLQAISTWTSAGASMVYSPVCSSNEVEALRTLLGDRRSNELELQGLTSSYTAATSQIFGQTVAQLADVELYNSLFVANQSAALQTGWRSLQQQLGGVVDASALAALVDQRVQAMKLQSQRLADCATKKGGANTLCPAGTVVDSYSALLGQLTTSYAQLQSLGQANVRQLTLYSAAVTRKLAEVQAFFNLLYPVADGLAQLNINVLNIPSLGDVPSIAPNTAFLNALAGSVDLPDVGNYFSQRMAGLTASWGAEWEEQRAAIRNQLERSLGNITSAIRQAFPPDPLLSYNPPPVHAEVDALQSQLSANAEAFKLSSEAGIAKLISLPKSGKDALAALANDTDARMPANVTALSFSLPPLSTLSLHMPFEGLTGSFDLSSGVLILISALGGVLLLADYVYRGTASVRVLRQYTRAPAEMLPVIDARTAENKDASARAQANSSSVFDKIAYWGSHTGLLVGVVVVFLSWVLALLIMAYIPLYTAYSTGCVQSNNGTFLSHNSYGVLYNLASLDSNKMLPLQLGQFESRRMVACGRYEQRYVTQQGEASLAVASSRSAQRTAAQQMDLIAKCLDPGRSFDVSLLPVNASTDSLVPDPLASLTLQMLDSCAVDADASSSTASVAAGAAASGAGSFNCSWLPACELTSCPGPSAVNIRSTSHDASCATEYVAHHGLLYAVLALLIFLCLNVSRAAFLKAMVRLGWRALTPAGLTFLATCDHSGKQLHAEEKDEGDRSSRRSSRRRRHSRSHSQESSSDSSDDENSVSSRRPSRVSKTRAATSAGLVSRRLLVRSMQAYEQSASMCLLLTLLAHVPYLLLLFVLNDPLQLGSSLHVAQPKPYSQA